MIDYTKFLPFIFAAIAIAMAVSWFVVHDRAVAAKAVAVDRADAGAVVLAAQEKSLVEKQKVIDYADELSKERYAQLQAARASAAQYRTAYDVLAADPDVARVLGTRLPESLRQLRRTDASASGSGDRVPVFRSPGMAAADTGPGAPGSNSGRPLGRDDAAAPSAALVQPGQSKNAPANRPAEATASRWWNPMNWFNPARNAP